MTKIVMKSYYTGKIVKTIKLNEKARGRSITYGPEWVGDNERFVIRDYRTNAKLQSAAMPSGSVQYWVE